jgi:LPXTG-site transpeptidase (sortase) family protein
VRPPRLVTVACWTTAVGGVLGLALAAVMAVSLGTPDVSEDTGIAPGGVSVTTEPPAAAVRTSSPPGTPLVLRIPALGVRAPVVAVALAPGGVLAPPADPDLVGWWSAGARPGDLRGTAVLTGHTVHDGAGVFDDLGDLQVGDAIQVVTRARVLVFGVRAVRDLSKERLAAHAGRLFAQDGDPDLVLVTCTEWDDGRYLANTVVVARAR